MDRLASIEFKIYLEKFLKFQEFLEKRLSASHAIQLLLDPIRNRSGKQLRPRLFFLASRPHKLDQSAVHIAVGLELLHLASIIHDDILDLSPKRRGDRALWQSQGTHAALLCGDLLLAEAFSEFSRSGMERIVLPVIRTLVAGMVRAELLQSDLHFQWGVPESRYLRIMKQKTARFFGVSAGLGAEVSGAPRKTVGRAYRFGMLFGMAYQLSDDVRDLFSEDLSHGILSLPAHWIGGYNPKGEKLLQKICKNKRLQPGDQIQLQTLLTEKSLLLRFEREICAYLKSARNCLIGMDSWNRMRLEQFLNDTEPYLLGDLLGKVDKWENPEVEHR